MKILYKLKSAKEKKNNFTVELSLNVFMITLMMIPGYLFEFYTFNI